MSGIAGAALGALPSIGGFAPLPSAAAMGFMTAQGMMSGLMFGFAYKMGTRFADSFDDEDMKAFRDNPHLAIELLTPHIKEIETWLMSWTTHSADQIQKQVMEKSLDLEKLKAQYNFRLLGTLPKQYLDMFLKGIIPGYDGAEDYDPNSDPDKFKPKDDKKGDDKFQTDFEKGDDSNSDKPPPPPEPTPDEPKKDENPLITVAADSYVVGFVYDKRQVFNRALNKNESKTGYFIKKTLYHYQKTQRKKSWDVYLQGLFTQLKNLAKVIYDYSDYQANQANAINLGKYLSIEQEIRIVDHALRGFKNG